MQVVAELLDSEIVTVSESMDITDSSIAQLCIPTTTSDAATPVPITKMRSVSTCAHERQGQRYKLLHNYKILQHNIHRNTSRQTSAMKT